MIRLLLVEDQEIVREGLRTLLEIRPDLQVVGEASNGLQAVELVDRLQSEETPPDVILMDIRMPTMDGVTATRLICQKHPGSRILVLTTFDDVKYVAEALRFGAKGYLLKDTPSEELADVIRSIYRGYTQFGPGILERMMNSGSDRPRLPPPELDKLSPRERQILRMLGQGCSNREIAQTLFLSEGTVRNYISQILTQMDLRDRTQAAVVANSFLDWLESE